MVPIYDSERIIASLTWCNKAKNTKSSDPMYKKKKKLCKNQNDCIVLDLRRVMIENFFKQQDRKLN